MRIILWALLVVTACTEHGQSPPDAPLELDAKVFADAPVLPSCQSLGCATPAALVDPNCVLTGAECFCANPALPAPGRCDPGSF